MVNMIFWFVIKPNEDADTIKTVVTRYVDDPPSALIHMS